VENALKHGIARLPAGGGLVATLRGGRTVEMSRRQSARLREILSL